MYKEKLTWLEIGILGLNLTMQNLENSEEVKIVIPAIKKLKC